MGRQHSQARVARVCPHWDGGRVGVGRHLIFECPALEHVQRRHGRDSCRSTRPTMRIFMWHKDQKAVASCLLQLFSEYAGLPDVQLT